MTPLELIKKGISIIGRTLIECCIDLHSIGMALETRKMKNLFFPNERPIVIDLFVGSGNLMFHISNELNAINSIGFEYDKLVYESTKNNLSRTGFSCEFYEGCY